MVSVEQFVHGKKDVLVATDIASKGLDFPNIQHVVNYDMPDDIENYGRLLLTVCIHFSTIIYILFQFTQQVACYYSAKADM